MIPSSSVKRNKLFTIKMHEYTKYNWDLHSTRGKREICLLKGETILTNIDRTR